LEVPQEHYHTARIFFQESFFISWKIPYISYVNQLNKYTIMREPKKYLNGNSEQPTDFRVAKNLLIKAGVYRTLGNFGPYFPNKESRTHNKLETFVLEGMEFTIIESEVMSFSFNTLSVSAPQKQKEAWFQPVK